MALKPEENQDLQSNEELFPNKMRTNKIKNEIDEIKNKNRNRKKKLREAIRSLNDNIYSGKIALNVAGRDQSDLLKNGRI